MAWRAHELFGLRVLEPPFELPAAKVVALWSQRHDEDPAQRSFRDLFLSGRGFSTNPGAPAQQPGGAVSRTPP